MWNDFMYMYMCGMNAYMYACICVYMCTCIYVCENVYACISISIHVCIYLYERLLSCPCLSWYCTWIPVKRSPTAKALRARVKRNTRQDRRGQGHADMLLLQNNLLLDILLAKRKYTRFEAHHKHCYQQSNSPICSYIYIYIHISVHCVNACMLVGVYVCICLRDVSICIHACMCICIHVNMYT